MKEKSLRPVTGTVTALKARQQLKTGSDCWMIENNQACNAAPSVRHFVHFQLHRSRSY